MDASIHASAGVLPPRGSFLYSRARPSGAIQQPALQLLGPLTRLPIRELPELSCKVPEAPDFLMPPILPSNARPPHAAKLKGSERRRIVRQGLRDRRKISDSRVGMYPPEPLVRGTLSEVVVTHRS